MLYTNYLGIEDQINKETEAQPAENEYPNADGSGKRYDKFKCRYQVKIPQELMDK